MYDTILSLISEDDNAADNMAKLEKILQAVVLSLDKLFKYNTTIYVFSNSQIKYKL